MENKNHEHCLEKILNRIVQHERKFFVGIGTDQYAQVQTQKILFLHTLTTQ